MSPDEADDYARELVHEHAPSMLPRFVLAWARELKGMYGYAILDVSWARRASEYDTAMVVINATEWEHLDSDDRKRLIEHEVGHLVADWRMFRRGCAHHGADWRKAMRELGWADADITAAFVPKGG